MNVESFSIGELCSSVSERYTENLPYVRLVNTSDILEGELLPLEKVKNENLKGQFKKAFKNGDILFSEIRPANRRFAFIENENTKELIASTKLMVIRANKDKVIPKYLYYFLTSQNILNKLQNLAETRSGTFPQITFSGEIAPISIKLPNIAEQNHIVNFIDAINSKILINKKINKNLYKLIKLNSTLFFSSLKASEIKTVFLSEIADFVSGYSYKGDELKCSDIGMATIKNFDRKGGFKIDGYKEIIPSSKLKSSQFVDDFDSLVAHTDITQNADVIGNAEIVLSNVGYKKLIFSMDLVKVIPKGDKISKFVIATLLQRADFKNHCLSYVNGTTVLHLSKKALPSYELSLPRDENKLIKLNAKIEPLFKLISNNFNENLKLKSLKESLLTKLISGEIDINNPNK